MGESLRRILVCAFICVLVLCESSCNTQSNKNTTLANSLSEATTEAESFSQRETAAFSGEEIKVSKISADRVSSSALKVMWSFEDDSVVDSYSVLRRCEKDADPQWIEVKKVNPNGSGAYEYIDSVDSSRLAQYTYRIDIIPKDKNECRGVDGSTCLISNILICLDPGHFLGSSHLEGEKLYNYEEGVVTLKIGLALSDILKEEYGITTYLTRESDIIKINGYTNGGLDHYHINLRGEYAAGSDLFISLHTNANVNNANGYPTLLQPISINKPIILANTYACASVDVVGMCNEIGMKLSKVYARAGLATIQYFEEASTGSIKNWTQDYNDGLDVAGTVCKRVDSEGDYYGVLRGAANVGVPGIIIEHGHHTVAEFRNAAMNGNLIMELARADAAGIATIIK